MEKPRGRGLLLEFPRNLGGYRCSQRADRAKLYNDPYVNLVASERLNTGSSSRIVETRWRAGLFREGKRGTESRRSRVIEYRGIRSTVSRRSNAHLRDCEKLGSATVNKRRRRREDVARVESRVAIKVAIIGIRNARGKINNDSFPLIRKGKERPGRLSIGELLIKEREKKKKKWDDARLRIVAANSSSSVVRENA